MDDLTQFILRKDVAVEMCSNEEADKIFIDNYWMTRKRRSRRISYSVEYLDEKVAWIQCADPFGTKLAKPLQIFDINESIELARGYFLDFFSSSSRQSIPFFSRYSSRAFLMIPEAL